MTCTPINCAPLIAASMSAGLVSLVSNPKHAVAKETGVKIDSSNPYFIFSGLASNTSRAVLISIAFAKDSASGSQA